MAAQSPWTGNAPADAFPDPAWWVPGVLPRECATAFTQAGRPAWVNLVERAVRVTTPWPGDVPLPAHWREAFTVPLRSLIAEACEQLVNRARECLGLRDADLHAVAGTFARQLGDQLVDVAARVLVLELNERRAAGQLGGSNGRERFADFVRRLTAPGGLAALFAGYPVLARLLGEAALLALDAQVELLVRLAVDRAAIVESLFGGVDPGPAVAIEARRGDPHRRGRSVSIVVFANDRRVVYRPRDVMTHVRFAELVEWLNRAVPKLELHAVAVVVRQGYGWLEFVDCRPLTGQDGADRFYYRLGALLALLHAVHAADIHQENVIACGDQPVLVDVEALFHPSLPFPDAPEDPAARTMAASVHRTGLLPQIIVGEHGAADLSGLGGGQPVVSPMSHVDWEFPTTDRMRLIRRAADLRRGLNRPRLGEQDIDPAEHTTALLHGFRHGYDAIRCGREEFTTLIDGCADIEVRVIARPTQEYATLLDETTHPDLLRAAGDRDRFLRTTLTGTARDPLHRRLATPELADLWAGDIPLVSGRPGSRDLWTSDGERLPGQLDRTGLSWAQGKLATMGEADRRDQEWIISATMATRRPAVSHASTELLPAPITGTPAHPERLLAAACAVADQIVAGSMMADGRVNWLGLELVDDRQWQVLPMGAGLANGYVGVALFLAQLAEVSGVARYGQVARNAVDDVPRLFETLAAHPAMVTAIGCGGMHGLGGIAYALARLATLLADTEIRDWVRIAVELAKAAATEPDPPGWANGTAGCLAAMTATHIELDMDEAAQLANSSTDLLVTTVETGHPLPAGFAEGAAGVAWALARIIQHGPDKTRPRYTRAVRAAASLAATEFEANEAALRRPGWCSGAAGLLLARSRRATADRIPAEPGGDVDHAARVLTERPVLHDLSLCHGELGITDALTAARAAGSTQRRAELILDAIGRYGPSCGTPDRVPTPGLLNGLAGIGYGLLRLAFPEQVPSVLLLEPTPTLARNSSPPPATSHQRKE